jgi:hypothetical protein
MLGWLLLALAVGYGAARVAFGYPRPKGRFMRLARSEVAFLAAASEASYPPGGEVEASGLEADIPAYVDRLLNVSHPRTRLQMRMLFLLFEHATLCFPAPGRGGFRRFSSLRTEQRIAVLKAWAGSRFWQRRLVFASLRAILTLGYFANPAVLHQLGLVPFSLESPICEADLLYPRIGAHPTSIPYSRDDLTDPSDGTPIPPDTAIDSRFAEGAQ